MSDKQQKFIKKCLAWTIGFLTEEDRKNIESALEKGLNYIDENHLADLLSSIAYQDERDGMTVEKKEMVAKEIIELINKYAS